MAATATVTAKSGPAQQSTAVPLTGVTGFTVDIDQKTIRIFQGGKATDSSAPVKEFEMSGNTFTVTIASGAITAITIS